MTEENATLVFLDGVDSENLTNAWKFIIIQDGDGMLFVIGSLNDEHVTHRKIFQEYCRIDTSYNEGQVIDGGGSARKNILRIRDES